MARILFILTMSKSVLLTSVFSSSEQVLPVFSSTTEPAEVEENIAGVVWR